MDGQMLTVILFVINGLMCIVGAAVMWWVNVVWTKTGQVERQLHLFEVGVARDYVSNTELERMLKPIMDELQKIDRKLDLKMDKAEH